MSIVPPTGDTRVYVARARQGIPAHQLADDGATTVCGRACRSGQTMWADEAIAGYAVTWCEQCWEPR